MLTPVCCSGATFRLGPELELTGYGCEDHFLESDTETHAWESLAALLASGATDGLLVDTGLPCTHAGVRYNVRALLLDRRVLLLRPKLVLADDGNYRESRWFAPWAGGDPQPHPLPACVTAVAGQAAAPFGDAGLRLADATLAVELCEELFVPAAPHVRAALSGAEVLANGSGSHTQLRKLAQRVELLRGATAVGGGAYLYSNQRGCDGGRLYYDGCACVALNGQLVAQGQQFGLADCEVVTATVDLDEVAARRGAHAALRAQAAALQHRLPFIDVPGFRLCAGGRGRVPCAPRPPRLLSPEQEIAMGPACWLWDYLRRSGAAGFLLPLSGGADSAATAAIVGSMCQLACDAAASDPGVAADVRRLAALPADAPLPADARALVGALLTTLYMSTEHSGAETRRRAAALASEIGCQHLTAEVGALCSAFGALFCAVTRAPAARFASAGGDAAEHLALQNIQARVRMVTAFLFAQLLPWARARRGGGFLLVLGSANVDESLRGYMTKYDCSSADVNPIGSISKSDLRSFLCWAAVGLGYPSLAEVAAAPPTAELAPPGAGGREQTDEEDMGLSYDELSVFGRLRQLARAGPLSMYRALRGRWGAPPADGGRGLSASAVADKVKRFFRFYAANRHKATTLTPAYHAEAYSPDDNRFDLRPFLYNIAWPRQFAAIDKAVKEDLEDCDVAF